MLDKRNYTGSGERVVRIYGDGPNGSAGLEAFQMCRDGKSVIIGVKTFGTTGVSSMAGMFAYCNHDIDVEDLDVRNVTDMDQTFAYCWKFNGSLAKWNVSNVTAMFGMFDHCLEFNGRIEKWDTSNVTTMESMFSYAHKFDRDISKWDVSKVITMQGMFMYAIQFNAPIEKWNTSNVTTMGMMFYNASEFNRPIASWDVSKVTYMAHMFRGALRFTDDISTWNPPIEYYKNAYSEHFYHAVRAKTPYNRLLVRLWFKSYLEHWPQHFGQTMEAAEQLYNSIVHGEGIAEDNVNKVITMRC
tara:strand:- start:4432 stop:5331 length:900 start_codon:yes stop_codon:yes gene_type:complete